MKKNGLLFCLLALASCGLFDSRRDIEAFYFPYKNLQNGQVYEYKPVGSDSAASEFWYLRSERRGGRWWLISQLYNPDFSLGQNVAEEIFPSGSLARQILLFENDSASGRARQITTTIEEAAVFPFKVSDSTGVFLFKLKYKQPQDSATTIYLIRNRRFRGPAPDLLFHEKTVRCVAFSLREVVGNESEGASEIEGRGEEIYGEGLGLVSYKKDFGRGLKMDFRLVDIFPMSELERRAKRHLTR